MQMVFCLNVSRHVGLVCWKLQMSLDNVGIYVAAPQCEYMYVFLVKSLQRNIYCSGNKNKVVHLKRKSIWRNLNLTQCFHADDYQRAKKFKQLKRQNLEFSKSSFFYSGVKTWNEISLEIRMSSTITIFKRKLKEFLQNQHPSRRMFPRKTSKFLRFYIYVNRYLYSSFLFSFLFFFS